jgi:predicted HicB family RNase H-like nuclease
MSVSEAQKRANAKHDSAYYEYITFKARKGARARIVQAAQTQGVSTNGFIRAAVDGAVKAATGVSMEREREMPEV